MDGDFRLLLHLSVRRCGRRPDRISCLMEEILAAYMPICGLPDRKDWPNSCNLNLYENSSMSVGWHADDEPIFKGKVEDARIISVTLGHTRTFELRRRDVGEDEDERLKYVMTLGNGDV